MRGEVVGIIGRNGAGKSTLLKILSKITEPTEGKAELRGRVGSLLEVGTGFHPELTGHENVYLYGAILGMDRWEISSKFDEIIAFAELEKFIDTPVKRYSSGMYMRLAFAVAAHLEPEILLVDEVLAVGDIAFQKKCLGKMGDVTKEGRTVLFVSHNLSAIKSLTQKSICLENGSILASGSTDDVMEKYLSLISDYTPSAYTNLVTSQQSEEQSEPILQSLEIVSKNKSTSMIPMGKPITFKINYSAPYPIQNPKIGLGIDSEEGIRILSLSTWLDLPKLESLESSGIIYCSPGALPLNQGRYYVKMVLADSSGDLEVYEQACKFEITIEDVFGSGHVPSRNQGLIYWSAKWEFEKE
jgi:lipopolysaccharide transport system ATP-binding protein